MRGFRLSYLYTLQPGLADFGINASSCKNPIELGHHIRGSAKSGAFARI